MALSASRDTKQATNYPVELYSLPVAASTTLYAGALVAINQSGYAVAASADSTLRVIGRCEATVVNSGSAGAKNVDVKAGAFWYANSSTTGAITDADIGRPAFVVDDETVSRISSYGVRPPAGLVVDVSSTLGVLVQVGLNEIKDGNHDVLMIAGSDLAAAQYLAVALAADGEVDVVGAAGAMITGILQNAPAASAVAIVRVAGITNWIAVTTTAIGAALASSTTTGKAKVAVASDASAVGSNAFGISIGAGVTDTAMKVLIARMGLLPATAA